MDPIAMGVATAFIEDELDCRKKQGIDGLVRRCKEAGYSSLDSIPQSEFDRYASDAGLSDHLWSQSEKDWVIRQLEKG